jgi:hypothetical protein
MRNRPQLREKGHGCWRDDGPTELLAREGKIYGLKRNYDNRRKKRTLVDCVEGFMPKTVRESF